MISGDDYELCPVLVDEMGNIQQSVVIALAMPSDTPSDTSFFFCEIRQIPIDIPLTKYLTGSHHRQCPAVEKESLLVPLPVRVKANLSVSIP